jgi:hypothetical protein
MANEGLKLEFYRAVTQSALWIRKGKVDEPEGWWWHACRHLLECHDDMPSGMSDTIDSGPTYAQGSLALFQKLNSEAGERPSAGWTGRKPVPTPNRVSNSELQAEIDATHAVLAKAGYPQKKP